MSQSRLQINSILKNVLRQMLLEKSSMLLSQSSEIEITEEALLGVVNQGAGQPKNRVS